MELARTLHKSLAEIMALDSREIGLWMALYSMEAEEQHNRDLIAKAEAARTRR